MTSFNLMGLLLYIYLYKKGNLHEEKKTEFGFIFQLHKDSVNLYILLFVHI